jgi:molybdopterin-guanine dinucleotide biosynthesis protein MobB
MTRFVAVVGEEHTGKKTSIQQMVSVLKSRGFCVATIKEMKSINPKHGSKKVKDMWKYGKVRAEITVTSPQGETGFFLKQKISLNEISPLLQNVDYAILEGVDNEEILPKIITGKTAKEVLSFSDGLVIAISGTIAEEHDEAEKVSTLGVPILNGKTQSEQLVNIVEQKTFNILPNLAGCTKHHHLGECGYPSCYEHAKAIVTGKSNLRTCPLEIKEDLTIEVNGVKLPLKEFPKKIVKNTLLGMISSLHGSEKIQTLKIEMRQTSQRREPENSTFSQS